MQFKLAKSWQPRLPNQKHCSGFLDYHARKLVSTHLVSLPLSLTHFTRLLEWSSWTLIRSCIPFRQRLSRPYSTQNQVQMVWATPSPHDHIPSWHFSSEHMHLLPSCHSSQLLIQADSLANIPGQSMSVCPCWHCSLCLDCRSQIGKNCVQSPVRGALRKS